VSWVRVLTVQLSTTQRKVLRSLATGATLKSHRYLSGAKVHKLYSLDGAAETVWRSTVQCLRQHGLIESNQKFPVATYLLTDRGRTLAAGLQEETI